MSWTATKKIFGVCGNFKYIMYDLTDMQDVTKIIDVKGLNSIKFTCATNTTDNTDVVLGGVLNLSATASTDNTDAMEDNTEEFSAVWSGLVIDQTSDNTRAWVIYEGAGILQTYTLGTITAVDAFPVGNEAYKIHNERYYGCLAGTDDDDGTVLIIGD